MRELSLLTVAALILLPFDSLPGIFPTTYRPISLIFLLPIVFSILLRACFKLKLDRYLFYLFATFLLFTITSFTLTQYFSFALNGFWDYIITFALGITAFAAFRHSFQMVRQKSESNDHFTEDIFKYLTYGYIAMIVIGCIEFLSLYTPLLPTDIKNVMNSLLAGKVSSRLQLTTGEPAWAARQALFGLPVLAFIKGKYNFWTIALFILAVLTFSLEGMLVFLLSTIIYLLYRFWDSKLLLFKKFAKTTISLTVLLAIIFFAAKNVFLKDDSYYYSRFKKLSTVKLSKIRLSNLVYLDESVFIRLAYPIAAWHIFFDYPIVGIGGGNFRYRFADYLKTEFPLVKKLNFHKVEQQIKGKKDQPKNFYSRLMSEFGLVGIILFALFLKKIIRRLRTAEFLETRSRNYLFFWLIICLVSLLQFDSFAYINFWLLAAFVLTLRPVPERIKELVDLRK